VYPGYSTTAEPSGISRVSGSFYWQAYQGDPVRHGNQGLSAFRAVMAMGIFMDNEIMYERALRFLQGFHHRSDDLPYPAGPQTATSISKTGDYEDTYNYTVGNSIEDFGYNEVITNYIYANGQCQESSRDQQHTFFGIGTICAMAEMAWNQGDDLYSHADDRLLLGLEYSSKYNVSYLQSYPDQTTHWVPTVDSGEFTQRFNASQRVYAKFISPTHVGGYVGNRPMLEMPLGHYYGRGFKTMEEVKWTSRARDIAIDKTGYEDAGHQNGSIGWGALTSRRADGCYGDPISGFDSNNSLPQFSMNVLGGVIEAENFDYFMVNGQDHVYNDISSSNSGGAYRTDENVDIKTCSEGGFNLTDIESGEWLTYTVYVPDNGTYDLSIRYAANNGDGKIKFNVGGTDITSDVAVPYGAPNSTGLEDWKDFTVASSVTLSKGIQPLKIFFSGADAAFELNNFNVSLVEATAGPINYALEGAATQSSTFFGGEASRAIDDNISGLWDSGSITFTNSELNAWWQVALTKEINVGAINIFNWKGFESRLSDFTVSVIDANGATTFSKVITTVQDETFTVNAGGALGEIVKVQLNNTNFLSLAEVQVFADPTSLSVSDEFINLNLYPNPVSKILNVSLNDLGFELNNTKIVLHSISGKKVFEQKVFSEKVEMNLEDLATGIYIITINDNHKTISKKILKK
jgi:hypothetical protein